MTFKVKIIARRNRPKTKTILVDVQNNIKEMVITIDLTINLNFFNG